VIANKNYRVILIEKIW